MNDPACFFIVGTPRSGTTLLQSMLMRSAGVAIPPELHYVDITFHRRRRMADIRAEEGWQQARCALLARGERFGIDMDRKAFDQRCDRSERTYAGLLRCWLSAIGTAEDATTVGEKTPGNAMFVLELAAMLPEARFVHIIRDPRDTVLSQKEAFGLPPILAALRWKANLEKHRDCAQLLSTSRYTSVHYEELVTDPKRAIQRLCDFLRIEFRPEMLDPAGREKRGFASFETHKLRTLENVTTSRIGRYKGGMSAVDIAVVEHFCGELMIENGYELENRSKLRACIGILAQTPHAVIHRALAHRRLDKRLVQEARSGRAVVYAREFGHSTGPVQAPAESRHVEIKPLRPERSMALSQPEPSANH